MYNIISIHDLRNAFISARISGKLANIGDIRVFHDSMVVETSLTPDKVISSFRALLPDLNIVQQDDIYCIELNASKAIDIIFDAPDKEIQISPYPFTPLLRDIALLDTNTNNKELSNEFLNFPERETGIPNIHTFFSFKGGVGRTMLLTSLVRYFAQELKSDFSMPKILLIDADTEAPGLTWWAIEKMGKPMYSYLDFLADAAEETEYALNMAQKAISAMRWELGSPQQTVFYLPAFRNHIQLLRPPMSPDELTLNTTNPWIMGDMIAQLGNKLGVEHIFIDLRAGMSELSSPLFFDPRVRRILITTTSKQSIEGTLLALNELNKFVSLSRKSLCTPYADNTRVIINFVPPDEKDNKKFVDLTERLEQAIGNLFQSDDSSDTQDAETGSWLFSTDYDQSLLGLGNFDNTLSSLEKSVTIREVCSKLWQEFIPQNDATTQNLSPQNMRRDIDILIAATHKLIFAETIETEPGLDIELTERFLKIESYRQLAASFLTTTPNACVIGAKGSGKTFLYILLVYFRKWNEFCKALDMTVESDINLIPLFWSRNLCPSDEETMRHTYSEGISHASHNAPLPEDIIRFLESNFGEPNLHKSDAEWRDKWYEYLCQIFCVMVPPDESYEESFRQRLSLQKQPVVFLLDGLEDLFSKWLDYDESITPLRIFLQEIMRNIYTWSNKKVGFLLFIRKDIVQKAIQQNSSQFIAQYSKYELLWSKEEALRLVGWILIAANLNKYCGNTNAEKWSTLSFEEMSSHLVSLWGTKLGAPNSKEAYSVNWALSAISDFKGNIQARDVVRLLYESSRQQKSTPQSPDRLLSPSALKSALDECGRQKIVEIKKEMPVLEESLTALRESRKPVPLSLEDFSGAALKNINLMEEFGLIFRDEEGKYYLPEIYRRGLELALAKGARPKVVSLMRKALGQA